VLRVGHRGAAALAAENTLDAVRAALDHGLDMVEVDVVRGTDGDLVLAHARGDIRSDSPTLDAALEFVGREAPPETTIALDLKVGDAATRVIELLERHRLVDRTIVCALHAAWLVEARGLCPGIATGISYPRDRAGVGERPAFRLFVQGATSVLRWALPLRVLGMATRAQADAVMLHHSVISRDVVVRCASRGLPVLAWTVDDPALASAVVRAGVRGVISNDPRVLEAI
jgi:glycerophosphoryl diester phosphodiesterase